MSDIPNGKLFGGPSSEDTKTIISPSLNANVSPLDLVLSKLSNVKRNGKGWIARCPAHEDKTPSLAVTKGQEERVLLKCFAGCRVDQICSSLGLTTEDLFVRKHRVRNDLPISDMYDYTDEYGNLLYQVVRLVPKSFRQRRPDGKGDWYWGLGDVSRVPYCLPDVVKAVKQNRWILIVEGEKDVETLRNHHFIATCNSGGAGKWREEWGPFFKGTKVAVIPDSDEPGSAHADDIVRKLSPYVKALKRVDLPGPEKDVTDWLKSHDRRELKELVLEATQVSECNESKPQGVLVAGELVTPAVEITQLSADVEEVRWLVEGVLERQDRVVLTGLEGCGKTTFMRQFSVLLASGKHPFDRTRIDPVSSLHINLESTTSQQVREYRKLLEKAGENYQHMVYVKDKPDGINLIDESHQEWLDAVVGLCKPDLVIFGPLYKAVRGSSWLSKHSEESAEIVSTTLDTIRVNHDCAIIVEAHSGHEGRLDNLRPTGSSLWLRWPEAGVGIQPAGDNMVALKRWRMFRNRDSETTWPRFFHTDGLVWPFEAALDARDL